MVLVKQAYAECSDHGMLARALLRAPLHRVRAYCHLTPGTPVAPMLAKPTKSVDEVLKRLSGQRLTVEFKYDGERMQLHRLKVPKGRGGVVLRAAPPRGRGRGPGTLTLALPRVRHRQRMLAVHWSGGGLPR